MTDLRYPIGKFQPESQINDTERQTLINQIADTPARLRKAVEGLTEEQLNTSYRPGGWTVRQIVHHLSDAHLNGYARFRLGLTEEQPTVKPYEESLWAELCDAKTAPISLSLTLFESLHERWALLLRSLKSSDFMRTVNHPEGGLMDLDRLLQLYAWHGCHHVAHITSSRERMGWK